MALSKKQRKKLEDWRREVRDKKEPVKKSKKALVIFGLIGSILLSLFFIYITLNPINSVNSVNSIHDDQLTETCYHQCIVLSSTYTTPMDIKDIFQNKTDTYCVCGGTKITQNIDGSLGDTIEITKEIKIA